jgi:hypothetical protein
MSSRTALGAAVLALMACGPVRPVLTEEDQPVDMDPIRQRYQHYVALDGQLDDGTDLSWVLDTGSPSCLIAQADPPAIIFEYVVFGGHVVVQNLRCEGDATLPAPALLGADVYGDKVVTLNYRDHWVSFSSTPPHVDDVDETAGWLAFHLTGSDPWLPTAASRVALKVSIEGQEYDFILDTGAEITTVRHSIADRLVSDGRATFRSALETTTENVSSRLLRAREIEVGGSAVQGIVVTDGPADDWFGGHDANLGGNFLEHFLVTIDYRRSLLRLQAYNTTAHVFDEFISVPLSLSARSHGGGGYVFYDYTVSGTFPTQQDASDLKGKMLTSIDGLLIEQSDLSDVETALSGAVGTAHMLGFDDGTSRRLLVEDVLPLGPGAN